MPRRVKLKIDGIPGDEAGYRLQINSFKAVATMKTIFKNRTATLDELWAAFLEDCQPKQYYCVIYDHDEHFCVWYI